MTYARLTPTLLLGVGLAALAFVPPKAEAVPLWQRCVEHSYQINGQWHTEHAFNTFGACYQGYPVAAHGIYTAGYCHSEHYDC
jgi:hypothetical protein